MPYIVAIRPPRQENFAAQQNGRVSRTGGGSAARFPPPPPGSPQPALDAAQPAVKRRHCRGEIWRVVAQPNAHCSGVSSGVSFTAIAPRSPSAAIPAASSIHAIERKRAAPSASAATGSPGSSRPSTSRASRCGRSASKRRISRSKTRSRGRSSGSTSSGAASTVSSMRREKAHKIACFDGNVR